jgi:hypothetical protein
MRIPAECPRCREIDERQSVYEVGSRKCGRGPHAVYLKEMPAADVHSEKLTLRCERGHITEATLPIPAFELLFDVGCSALLDGYPREAITTFASSFERFLEFTCRFLLARRNVSFEGVDAWRKDVKKQSERQRGSFVALWIADFRNPPPLLSDKLAELRNNCIHNGLIPPENKAREYGEAVLRSVVSGIVTLRNCFDSDLDYDDFVNDRVLRLEADQPHLSFIENTVLSGMWRRNEGQPDAGEAESGNALENRTRNTTDPTRLTMDEALRIFAGLRSLGLRRN